MTANSSSENQSAAASTQDVRGSGLSVASGSALWPCPENCHLWPRGITPNEPMTLHNPRCSHVDSTLIDVWRVAYDGRHYITDLDPADEPEILCGDETITKGKMHREIYENLPDLAGF